MKTPILIYLYDKKYCKTMRKYGNHLLSNDAKAGRREGEASWPKWRVWTGFRGFVRAPTLIFNPEEGQNFLKKHYEAGEAKCTCHPLNYLHKPITNANRTRIR